MSTLSLIFKYFIVSSFFVVFNFIGFDAITNLSETEKNFQLSLMFFSRNSNLTFSIVQTSVCMSSNP